MELYINAAETSGTKKLIHIYYTMSFFPCQYHERGGSHCETKAGVRHCPRPGRSLKKDVAGRTIAKHEVSVLPLLPVETGLRRSWERAQPAAGLLPLYQVIRRNVAHIATVTSASPDCVPVFPCPMSLNSHQESKSLCSYIICPCSRYLRTPIAYATGAFPSRF